MYSREDYLDPDAPAPTRRPTDPALLKPFSEFEGSASQWMKRHQAERRAHRWYRRFWQWLKTLRTDVRIFVRKKR